MTKKDTPQLYEGLHALVAYSFPKKCATCGRQYETAEEFIEQTLAIHEGSGLHSHQDDKNKTIVELYRNCVCGSTMLDFFNDRRDLSRQGQRRREKFEEIILYLVEKGLSKNIAREEILKVMCGEKSETLEKMGLDIGGTAQEATDPDR